MKNDLLWWQDKSSRHNGRTLQISQWDITIESDGQGCTGPSASGCMACLRKSFHTEGLSDRVIELRRSGGNPLNPHIQEPGSCGIAGALNEADPLSALVSEVLEFLLEQFETGKQYRTINTIRSAILMTYEEVDGTRIGQHPLVSRFFDHQRQNTPSHGMLTLSCLTSRTSQTMKSSPFSRLAMLMALSNADRSLDLAALTE